jgi:hypothetical protein
MATYTILTTREQEAGLNFAFEHYADEGQSKAEFLQSRVNRAVLTPMFADWKQRQAVSLELSIATIPEANETKASTEIQAVITANGGTLVPVGPPPVLPLPTMPPPPLVLP